MSTNKHLRLLASNRWQQRTAHRDCHLLDASSTVGSRSCLRGQQLIDREPCLLGNAFQEVNGRRMDATNNVADGGLADAHPPSKRGLRRFCRFQIGSERLHMSQPIGFTYSDAIGHSYSESLHARVMAKPRSFYDRAMEALREKYGEKAATQVKLAALAGVRQPSVNDWKEGYPTMDNGVRLASALGVCVQWLYTEEGPKHPPPKDGIPWSELTEAQRQQIEQFARFVRRQEK